MSNNFDITIYDFNNVCRTCLSREDLEPLYKKCFPAICLVDMLMSCTVVKFTEDDGLPMKICINCINEINQAFSFVKRCETTDTILRECLKNVETNLSKNVELMIKAEEEIKTESFMPTILRSVKEVLGDYDFEKEVKKEKDVNEKFEEYAEEVEEAKIEIEYNKIYDDSAIENKDDKKSNNPGCRPKRRCTNSQIEKYNDSETYDDPADEIYAEENGHKDQDEICSKKPDNSGSRRRYTNYQKGEKSSKTDDCETYDAPSDESYEEENDDQDETNFQKSDNPVSRQNFEIRKESSKDKTNQYKHIRLSKSNEQILLEHHQSRIHPGKKPYTCKICNKTFIRTALVKRHMKMHTGEKPYTCEVCSKTFTYQSRLKSHMKIHPGNKPHTCKICDKSFIRLELVKRHMKIHPENKPYCDVCNKAYTCTYSLKRHMKTHTGENPHTCEICSKMFTRPFSLLIHMRIHTGDKPYTCEICSKTFTQYGHLKNHMRNHTGKTQYTCEICSKIFTKFHSLNNHMRIYTREKSLTCEVCRNDFRLIDHLKSHMRY